MIAPEILASGIKWWRRGNTFRTRSQSKEACFTNVFSDGEKYAPLPGGSRVTLELGPRPGIESAVPQAAPSKRRLAPVPSGRMPWKRLLAYITGSVDQDLFLRNEYQTSEGTEGRRVAQRPVHPVASVDRRSSNVRRRPSKKPGVSMRWRTSVHETPGCREGLQGLLSELQGTGFPLVGLIPTKHTSLCWTHSFLTGRGSWRSAPAQIFSARFYSRCPT